MRCRIEKDKLGEKTIGQESYFGIGTERSKETFQMTKHTLSRQMIKALAYVKKAAAKKMQQLGEEPDDQQKLDFNAQSPSAGLLI